MNKEENVLKYYVLCNKLKSIVRSGWKCWKVSKDRVESVAEHIFGTQALAIAMYSEYEYDLDLGKVLLMLTIHELEEIVIGDLTPYEISKEEKEKRGHEAIVDVLSSLREKEYLKNLIIEFDSKSSKEALFAFHCDKLECDLQCKLYDEDKCVDLSNQEDNYIYHNEMVQHYLEQEKEFSKMWIECDRHHFSDDKNFENVLDYVKHNEIKDVK